jgi:hypothetical protein
MPQDSKDFVSGGAVIADKHANYIVNREHATSTDVLRIIDHVRNVVAHQFGIQLEPEGAIPRHNAMTGATMKRIRIGVILGVNRAKHEVSSVSAWAVLNGLDLPLRCGADWHSAKLANGCRG